MVAALLPAHAGLHVLANGHGATPRQAHVLADQGNEGMDSKEVADRLARIEAKLDALLDALAEDEDEQEAGVDLDGNAVGGERDEGETL